MGISSDMGFQYWQEFCEFAYFRVLPLAPPSIGHKHQALGSKISIEIRNLLSEIHN